MYSINVKFKLHFRCLISSQLFFRLSTLTMMVHQQGKLLARIAEKHDIKSTLEDPYSVVELSPRAGEPSGYNDGWGRGWSDWTPELCFILEKDEIVLVAYQNTRIKAQITNIYTLQYLSWSGTFFKSSQFTCKHIYNHSWSQHLDLFSSYWNYVFKTELIHLLVIKHVSHDHEVTN